MVAALISVFKNGLLFRPVSKNNRRRRSSDVFSSPLPHPVLSFSGLIVPESRNNETVPEVVTTSGYALLHFFSDAAYNLTGFNIAYSYVCSL